MTAYRSIVGNLVALFFLTPAGMGQVTSTGRTSDTLDGTKYFIVILPTDTADRDNMPIVSPEGFTGVDVPPVPLKQVAPLYPSTFLPKKLHGTVWVKCLVSASGVVLKAEAMKSENEIFNSAALEAAKQWTFVPAMVKGKPVATWAAIPFHFRGSK